ncbi:MAG: hypothetical protein ACOCWG_02755, partial [bacterium]
MSKYIEIKVKTNPVWSEYLSEILINKIGCHGVVLEEKEIKDDEVIKADIETVKAYLWKSEDFNAEKIKTAINEEKMMLINSGV